MLLALNTSYKIINTKQQLLSLWLTVCWPMEPGSYREHQWQNPEHPLWNEVLLTG